MNMPGTQSVWETLRAAGLVTGERPETGERPSPWYVRTMLGAAGWIGALFLLSFVGVAFAFVMKSWVAALITGLVCCLGAGLCFRAAGENDFAGQFALAVSFAGQIMVGFGLFEAFGRERGIIFFLLFLFEATLAVLLPNFVSRVLSAWVAMVALCLALHAVGFYSLAAPVAAAAFVALWMNEMRWAAVSHFLLPIGYGLALALFQIASRFNHLLLREADWRYEPHALLATVPRLGTALTAVLFLWTVGHLLRREGISLGSRGGVPVLCAAALLMIPSFWATGIAIALLVIVLGYAGGNRPLVGLGLLGLVGFLADYYYQLQATLLIKSAVLMVTGILLLGARTAMHRYFPPTAGKAERHA